MQPTDETTSASDTVTATADQDGKTLGGVLAAHARAEEALLASREDALYRALRLTIGDERYSDSLDAILDIAEYLRTGARGLPLVPPPVVHAEPGVEIEQMAGYVVARVAPREIHLSMSHPATFEAGPGR